MRGTRREAALCTLTAVAAVAVIVATASAGSTAPARVTVRDVARARSATPHGPACTLADAEKPLGAMPAPEAVTTRFLLDPAPLGAWLDPAPGVLPRVGAAAAWNRLSRFEHRATRVRLLFGYLTSVTPFDAAHHRPQFVHVPAWALYLEHEPFTAMQGPAPGQAAGVCIFATVYRVLDATTGTLVVEQARGGPG